MTAKKGLNIKPETKAQKSKLIACIFSGAVILIGLIGMGSGVWMLLQGHNCTRWPTAEGVIRTATISHSKPYRASISYYYQVAGIPYTGTRLAFGEDMARGQRILNRYPVGTKAAVHYLPDEPQLAVLETGVHAGVWNNLGIGTVFALFGWMGLQQTTNPGNQRRLKQQTPILLGGIFVVMGSVVCLTALSRGSSNWIGFGAGVFFVLCGLVLMAFYFRGKVS